MPGTEPKTLNGVIRVPQYESHQFVSIY